MGIASRDGRCREVGSAARGTAGDCKRKWPTKSGFVAPRKGPPVTSYTLRVRPLASQSVISGSLGIIQVADG
jgi:hypothetical protein